MIAILGSNSFMGSSLVDYFLSSGYEVLAVGRTTKNEIFLPFFENDNSDKLRYIETDINQHCDMFYQTLNELRPSVVINCIALGIVDDSWDRPTDYFTTNCSSLVGVVQYLSGCDYLDKFLQASTPEIYGNIPDNFSESRIYNPSTPYAASKAAFDMYLNVVHKQYGFPAIMFRFANIYGPHQQLFRIVPKTLIEIRKKGKLYLDGGGITRRSFVYSSDLCDGVHKLIQSGRTGEIYHFSGCEYTTMEAMVKKVCLLTGYDFKDLVEMFPERRGKDIEYNLNCDKAINELGWYPSINLEDGILKTDDWISKNWQEIEKCSVQ